MAVNTSQKYTLPSFRCVNPNVTQGKEGCIHWRYSHCIDEERKDRYTCRIQHLFTHRYARLTTENIRVKTWAEHIEVARDN
jgi:hypothetical protein